jgi:hypothetical protein
LHYQTCQSPARNRSTGAITKPSVPDFIHIYYPQPAGFPEKYTYSCPLYFVGARKSPA